MSNQKIITLLGISLIFIGYLAHHFFAEDPNKIKLTTLQQNLHFAWPAVGSAAIGTVEDGLLANSSDNEKTLPTASMAKVITALAIMEKRPFNIGQLGLTFTITRDNLASLNKYISNGGSVLPIMTGMRLTQYQAMQRMLIASDNNMADILVETIFGSMSSYISYAQKMLKHINLTRTVVADASGFNPATVSTPSELVAIGIAALRNPVIAKIVSQKQAQLPVAGIIKNTNRLLGINGVIGIKTGTTDRAGSCLLFAARYTNKAGQKVTVVGVIMGDKNHDMLYRDSVDLLVSAKQSFNGIVAHWTNNFALSSPTHRLSMPSNQ